MTLIELAKQVQEIESKYTKTSQFRLAVSVDQNMTPKYTLEHSTTGSFNTVSVGYGTTDIKELLTKFEMAMAAHYRFVNDKRNSDDITL